MHELPAQDELLCAIAIGEEAEVANALESIGQHVKEEAADEFVSIERHRLVLAVMAIIFPAKRDLAVIDIEQAIVGDGDTVRVPRDIVEDLVRPSEGFFGVDHPVLFANGSDVTQEGSAVTKWLQGGKELQITGVEGLPKIIDKQATKQPREHCYG